MVWWVEPAPPGFVLDSPTYLSDLHERPSCSGSEPSVLLHSLSFDTSRASRKLTLSFVPSLAYILLHLGFLWQALRAQWSKLFTGFARIERPCCFCSRIDSRREALKCPLKGKKRRSNCPATVERAISLEILFSEKKTRYICSLYTVWDCSVTHQCEFNKLKRLDPEPIYPAGCARWSVKMKTGDIV